MQIAADGTTVFTSRNGIDVGLLQERRGRYQTHRSSPRRDEPFDDVPVRFLAFDLLQLGDSSLLRAPYDESRGQPAALGCRTRTGSRSYAGSPSPTDPRHGPTTSAPAAANEGLRRGPTTACRTIAHWPITTWCAKCVGSARHAHPRAVRRGEIGSSAVPDDVVDAASCLRWQNGHRAPTRSPCRRQQRPDGACRDTVELFVILFDGSKPTVLEDRCSTCC
jgi:hypothetical protein